MLTSSGLKASSVVCHWMTFVNTQLDHYLVESMQLIIIYRTARSPTCEGSVFVFLWFAMLMKLARKCIKHSLFRVKRIMK